MANGAVKTAGLYRKGPDGVLYPWDPDHSNGREENGEDVEVYHARRHSLPSNPWEFAMKFAETFGFKALVTVIALGLLGGSGWLVYKLTVWNRADASSFQQTMEKNTSAVESMAAAQHEQTEAIKDMDDKLLKHLEKDDDERRRAHR